MIESETEIIEFFQDPVRQNSVFFLTESSLEHCAYNAIQNSAQWKKWTDASAHDAPPPDFYSDKMRLMMDVMKVEDHSHESKKRKLINPLAVEEQRMRKELEETGILERCPNAHVICNAKTDLPTNEDHRFEWYQENFRRVVEEHNRKIPLYQKNHPGYKTIFFIFDESTAYAQLHAGRMVCAPEQGQKERIFRPHSHAHDAFFQNVIKKLSTDVIIWFSPYKSFPAFSIGDMRFSSIYETAVIDVKKLKNGRTPAIQYPQGLMISSEV